MDTMKPTGKKLASYIRVSSDKQDTSRQRESIERWADAHGLPILFSFEDSEGKNPRDQAAKRTEFQKLLKAVEADAVDTIIVDSQDRFGTADGWELGKYITLLRENACELWSVAQGHLSGDDDATILTGTIGALTSAREQREKATRNLSGKIQKARNGEYQGGYPPYGFDVVCFGADGREKWRVVYYGHFQRVKVSGDSREAFDGKDNFPAKDPTDVLKLRPSIESERVANARQIFEWYATEDISPGQIAARLNEANMSPGIGEFWNKVTVRRLLKHPIYTGFPTFNKRAGSRFSEYVDGQIKPVARRVKSGRDRKPADYIQPSAPEFPPLAAPEVWERVQVKLETSTKNAINRDRRPAQTASLWLKSFLYCGKCNKPMRANQAAGKGNRGLEYPSYTCGNYGTYGTKNPSGCRCHRIHAGDLETLVYKYLEDHAPLVREMIQAAEKVENGSPLFDSTYQRLLRVSYERNRIEKEMASVCGVRNPFKIGENYSAAYLAGKPEIERQIAEREELLDELLDGFRGLSPKMRDRKPCKSKSTVCVPG
jgi:DNA invertase Pin-like site-specific DNA recombinase